MSIFLKRPVRYLITRGDLTGSNFRTEKHHTLAVVRSAVKVGIELIQLREKNLEAGPLFELARAASAITSGSTTRLLVNERFDIALASGADGVHLTSRSLPIEAVRRSVPAGFIVGRSTHTRSEVLDARSAGSDFALFGNVDMAIAGKLVGLLPMFAPALPVTLSGQRRDAAAWFTEHATRHGKIDERQNAIDAVGAVFEAARMQNK